MLSISEVLAIGRLQGAQQRLKKARRAGVKSVFLKAPVKGLRVFDVFFWLHGEALIRKQKDLQNSATEPVYLKPVPRLDHLYKSLGVILQITSFSRSNQWKVYGG